MSNTTNVARTDNLDVTIKLNNITLNPLTPLVKGPFAELVEWYTIHSEAKERVETRADRMGLAADTPFSVKLLHHKVLKYKAADNKRRMAEYVAMHLSEYPGVRVGVAVGNMLDKADVRGHKSSGFVSYPVDGGKRKYLEITYSFTVEDYTTKLVVHGDVDEMKPSTYLDGHMPDFDTILPGRSDGTGGAMRMMPIYKIRNIHIYPFNEAMLKVAQVTGHDVIGVCRAEDHPGTALPVGLALMHKMDDTIYDVLGTDVEGVFDELWCTSLDDTYTIDMAINKVAHDAAVAKFRASSA